MLIYAQSILHSARKLQSSLLSFKAASVAMWTINAIVYYGSMQ